MSTVPSAHFIRDSISQCLVKRPSLPTGEVVFTNGATVTFRPYPDDNHQFEVRNAEIPVEVIQGPGQLGNEESDRGRRFTATEVRESFGLALGTRMAALIDDMIIGLVVEGRAFNADPHTIAEVAATIHAPVAEPEERKLTRKESVDGWLKRSAALIEENERMHK